MLGLIAPLIPLVEKLIDTIFPDPAKAAEAKAKLASIEGQQVLNEMNIQLSAIMAEANSSDPWTSRARPTFLYLMYAIISICFLGGILSVWWPAQVAYAAEGIQALLGAIPESLWWLFGTGYLGYTVARGTEKWMNRKPVSLPRVR